MSLPVSFTDAAKQDLRDIWRGLADYSGLSVADRTLANIESKLRLLSQFPSSGRIRAELHPELRSYVAGEFTIFYRILEATVSIERVLNGRRDITALFDESES
jgi:toxin ParE1/3/4